MYKPELFKSYRYSFYFIKVIFYIVSILIAGWSAESLIELFTSNSIGFGKIISFLFYCFMIFVGVIIFRFTYNKKPLMPNNRLSHDMMEHALTQFTTEYTQYKYSFDKIRDCYVIEDVENTFYVCLINELNISTKQFDHGIRTNHPQFENFDTWGVSIYGKLNFYQKNSNK